MDLTPDGTKVSLPVDPTLGSPAIVPGTTPLGENLELENQEIETLLNAKWHKWWKEDFLIKNLGVKSL
jgi:hypothetical protein